MEEKYTLRNFLELTEGLKRYVETYEIRTTCSTIMFFFKHNAKEFGIWFAYDWMQLGVKTPDGGIRNYQECNYDENGNYLGQSEYNLKLKIEYGIQNFNFPLFLEKLESQTKNCLFMKHL